MVVRQIFDAESCSYTYLLICAVSAKAIIIDPVLSHIERDLKLINQLDLKLLFAADTHTHADHISASGVLSQRTGCEIVMGEETDARGADIYIGDNGHLKIGDVALRAIYTPGHTKDSYCYQVGGYLFTGDTLLIRGTGRCDFQNGSAKEQYHSIFTKLFSLPGATLVYPSHDYSGMTVSTLDEEKKHNPRLQVANANEYIEIMDSLNLPMPEKMNTAIPINLNCGLRRPRAPIISCKA